MTGGETDEDNGGGYVPPHKRKGNYLLQSTDYLSSESIKNAPCFWVENIWVD